MPWEELKCKAVQQGKTTVNINRINADEKTHLGWSEQIQVHYCNARIVKQTIN